MKIAITEKIRPFSHTPGIRIPIPNSHFVLQAFPALFRIEGIADFPLHVTGPIQEFTAQLDLEKQAIWIWGVAKEGHYRFKIEMCHEGIALQIDRCPKEGIRIQDKCYLRKSQVLLYPIASDIEKKRVEKLFLGVHKAQDWDLVWRRMDLKEIAPALFLLGQYAPKAQEATGAVADLLKDSFPLFVSAAFSDLLVPRVYDLDYQGIASNQEGGGDPFSLLERSYRKMRGDLLQQANGVISILPHLPKEWDAGRATNLCVEELGDLDLEWSRSLIRKMMLRAKKVGRPVFHFSNAIRRYRLNGKWIERGEEIQIEAARVYLFDQFQK